MRSIITKYGAVCLICGSVASETHHLIGGSNRKLSDNDGLTIPLCHSCHNEPGDSVHFNGKMKVLSHALAQLAWEKKYIIDRYELPFEDVSEESREAFRERYGVSYL
jgi:hypothetical protein